MEFGSGGSKCHCKWSPLRSIFVHIIIATSLPQVMKEVETLRCWAHHEEFLPRTPPPLRRHSRPYAAFTPSALLPPPRSWRLSPLGRRSASLSPCVTTVTPTFHSVCPPLISLFPPVTLEAFHPHIHLREVHTLAFTLRHVTSLSVVVFPASHGGANTPLHVHSPFTSPFTRHLRHLNVTAQRAKL